LTSSTSRFCFWKKPKSIATGTGVRQTAPAFHDSLSLRGGPLSTGASDDVLHIGNFEKSIAGAARSASDCAPQPPSGAANAAAAPPRKRWRRFKTDRRSSLSLMETLLYRHDAASAQTPSRCAASALKCVDWK
jgi:hypothetical protein